LLRSQVSRPGFAPAPPPRWSAERRSPARLAGSPCTFSAGVGLRGSLPQPGSTDNGLSGFTMDCRDSWQPAGIHNGLHRFM